MTVEGALVSGRYRLDQPIGRSRAGIVWLAYDTRLNRTVAAKRIFISPGLTGADAERAKATVVEQGRDAMRIAHTCVLTVHDVLIDADPWLIMEYVPSRNMAEFLGEHGQLTPEQAALLGASLSAALSSAHQRGVLHRSLEPRNVLLADDGGVRITDIGISSADPAPAYLAPEVRQGATPTPASDAFSLGATLYVAVEGELPFGPNGTGTSRQPRKTGELTGILLQLLQVNPTARPSMADMTMAFSSIAEGKSVTPPTPTLPATPMATDETRLSPGNSVNTSAPANATAAETREVALPESLPTSATTHSMAKPQSTAHLATTQSTAPTQHQAQAARTEPHAVAKPGANPQSPIKSANPTSAAVPSREPPRATARQPAVPQGTWHSATTQQAQSRPVGLTQPVRIESQREQPAGPPPAKPTAVLANAAIRKWAIVVTAVLIAAALGILVSELIFV